MSYDLLVFDPEAPPRDRAGFMQWYHALVQWDEDHDYNDPGATTELLRSWFMELIAEFPPMNGPLATDDYDRAKTTDYTICRQAIYLAFAWSTLDDAYRATFSLARKHRLGFFDVSADDGQVWLPNGANGFEVAHGNGSSMDSNSAAQEVGAMFKPKR